MNGKPALRALGAALIALLLSACGGGAPPELGPGLSCVDDSAHCIGQRQKALGHLVAEKDRAWVRAAPTPAAYASGVRMFAFKVKKSELTCEELAIGRREADGAAYSLRAGFGAGLTPGQVSRGKMFAAEVSRELAREHGKRCKR